MDEEQKNKKRTDDIEEKDVKDEQKGDAEKGKQKTAPDGPPLLDEPLSVRDYVYLNILSLDAKAWAYMDYVVHPETQKHKKDLEEAKNAIDVIDALYKILEKKLSAEQKKDIETRLTNLRLNFAKQ
jgi:hypothetical protein